MSVRLRVDPSKHQLALDKVALLDTLRQQAFAAKTHSLVELFLTIGELDGFKGSLTAKDLDHLLKKCGVQFKGKPLSSGMLSALRVFWTTIRYVTNNPIIAAIRRLEECGDVLGESTKIMRIFQTVTCIIA